MVDVNRSRSAEAMGNGRRWLRIGAVVAFIALVIGGAVVLLESSDDDGENGTVEMADVPTAPL